MWKQDFLSKGAEDKLKSLQQQLGLRQHPLFLVVEDDSWQGYSNK